MLGGAESVSEAERAVVEDLGRLGVVTKAEVSRYLQGDHAAGKTVASLAAARRSSLLSLGLEKRANEVAAGEIIDVEGRTITEAESNSEPQTPARRTTEDLTEMSKIMLQSQGFIVHKRSPLRPNCHLLG